MARGAPPVTQTLAAGVNTFPARVEIAKGDAVGLDNASGALLVGFAGEAVYVQPGAAPAHHGDPRRHRRAGRP